MPEEATTPTRGKLYGYARVSTLSQETDRQEVDLRAYGVRADDLYTDRMSGSRRAAERPAFSQVLDLLQEGDELAVTTLDRLGRTGTEMAQQVFDLHDQGVKVTVLNLGGQTVDTSSAMGRLLVQVLSAVAEAELAIKRERIRDSVEKRRKNKESLGGRPKAVPEEIIRGIHEDIQNGMSVAAACRKKRGVYEGVSRPTYYRRAEALGLQG